MEPFDHPEPYKIYMDRRWSLDDLYIFPRNFEQTYFLLYGLDERHDGPTLDRIVEIFRSLPWQGGYSAVSFYTQLKYLVPKRNRPEIIGIQYSSPGWMELSLYVSIALNVGLMVKHVAKSIKIANHTYTDIVRGMHDRKLLRLDARRKEMQFHKDELEYIESCSKQMAKLLGISKRRIDYMTKHSYLSLKILLSVYRRTRTLANYVNSKKADFPEEE